MNYNVKNVGYFENLDTIEESMTNDVYKCNTFGEIITTFNFWYGFLQGWFNSNRFTDFQKNMMFNILKDSTLEMVFVIDNNRRCEK